MNNTVLICCIVLCIVVPSLIIAFVIQILRGKSLDPSVKTLSQANKAIKYAQKLVYQRTGILISNYFQLKDYLKKNGLIPLNSKQLINDNQYFNDSHYDKQEHKPLADYCRENKIPTPAYGPDINFFKEDEFCKDVKGMVNRLLAMYAVNITVQAFTLSGGNVEEGKSISQTIIDKKGIANSLTDAEKDFLKSPTKEQAIQLSWQIESCFSLAWALGLSNEISPFHQLSVNEMQPQFEYLLTHKTIEIVNNIKLRSEDELKFWANVYYCCLWAVRTSALYPNVKLPKGLDPEVVEERYLSLAWILSNSADEELGEEPKRYDWDETPMDT